jgi:hypothetical protein
MNPEKSLRISEGGAGLARPDRQGGHWRHLRPEMARAVAADLRPRIQPPTWPCEEGMIRQGTAGTGRGGGRIVAGGEPHPSARGAVHKGGKRRLVLGVP